ncbi:MAG: right-handed parallel beta-helix repeat-containing protein [Planctomycetes bacterium]|nr:right-handed parallel beta-helix repeat-containing protein [Planctomycetota bacterium]
MNTFRAVSFLAAALLPAAAQATTIRVPADFPTIQAAVNATSGHWDIIEVSQGIYLEAVTLANKDELTLQAKKGHKVIIHSEGAIPLSVTSSRNIHLKNLRLEGATFDYGLNVMFSTDVLIQGCTVTGSGVDGIKAFLSDRVTVEDCTVKWVICDGIDVDGDNACLLGNTLLHIGWNGIVAVGTAHTIDGNTIKECGEKGIWLGAGGAATEGALVVKNKIDGAWQDGIYLDTGADAATILGNTVLRVDDDGIEVASGAIGNVLHQNNVSSTAGDGFEVHCLNGSFCKNKVKKAGDDGFWVAADAAYCLFFRNTITSSTSDGLQINCSYSAFVENTAKKSGGYDCFLPAGGIDNAYLGNKFGTVADM